MNSDFLTFFQGPDNPSQQREYSRRGCGHAAIGNRERDKIDAIRLGGVSFMNQVQLSGFFILEQRNHDIQTGASPTRGLVLDPVAATRPGGHGKPSAPGARYPEE